MIFEADYSRTGRKGAVVRRLIAVALGVAALLLFLCGALFRNDPVIEEETGTVVVRRPPAPVLREEPGSVPPDTNMPSGREVLASGRNDPDTFSPESDLVRFDDPEVWWESDHDSNDDEDDHLIYRTMQVPLRELIKLVKKHGGKLKVQDTYRPDGRKHVAGSLHREGRAIDVTCDEIGLEKLAKLCWVAGFDWVYHEAHARGGAHVHCSVRR